MIENVTIAQAEHFNINSIGGPVTVSKAKHFRLAEQKNEEFQYVQSAAIAGGGDSTQPLMSTNQGQHTENSESLNEQQNNEFSYRPEAREREFENYQSGNIQSIDMTNFNSYNPHKRSSLGDQNLTSNLNDVVNTASSRKQGIDGFPDTSASSHPEPTAPSPSLLSEDGGTASKYAETDC